MREVELKSVVDDLDACRKRVESAGGRLTFEGRLIDKRYGDQSGAMMASDHVLRLRVYQSKAGTMGSLDWKGPTSFDSGYKIREELSTAVADPGALSKILENVGFSVILEIDRSIWQYELNGATIRFEVYPRMDTLVEVEGTPEEIEAAIPTIGLERASFTADRLSAFTLRYEARTGQRAALSSRELAGDYAFSRTAT
jgi:predicted adenylyl cyclase CyaB